MTYGTAVYFVINCFFFIWMLIYRPQFRMTILHHNSGNFPLLQSPIGRKFIYKGQGLARNQMKFSPLYHKIFNCLIIIVATSWHRSHFDRILKCILIYCFRVNNSYFSFINMFSILRLLFSFPATDALKMEFPCSFEIMKWIVCNRIDILHFAYFLFGFGFIWDTLNGPIRIDFRMQMSEEPFRCSTHFPNNNRYVGHYLMGIDHLIWYRSFNNAVIRLPLNNVAQLMKQANMLRPL